jgi:hypothetical protein
MNAHRFVGLGEDPQVLAVRAPALFAVCGFCLCTGRNFLDSQLRLAYCTNVPGCGACGGVVNVDHLLRMWNSSSNTKETIHDTIFGREHGEASLQAELEGPIVRQKN